MDRKRKIGRNDPCPCGSGKKYKKCCGAASRTNNVRGKQVDNFNLNREIAYKGRIGRQRAGFCIHYIKHKQAILKKARQQQIVWATARGETITCHKGCSFCCVEHIPASLQECETIVYYLYQNKKVLRAFLQAYPRWIAQVDINKDLLDRIEQIFAEMVASGFSEESEQAISKEAALYTAQNIPCPFLSDNACLIYEVRPWTCASQLATTPAEWCNPLNPSKEKNKPEIYHDDFGGSVELPFYYKPFERQVYSFMPIMVYQILKDGFFYISRVIDLESLLAEVMNDSEVKAIIRKY